MKNHHSKIGELIRIEKGKNPAFFALISEIRLWEKCQRRVGVFERALCLARSREIKSREKIEALKASIPKEILKNL